MTPQHNTLQAIVWQDDCLHLLDQRLLPQVHKTLTLSKATEVAQAITDMVVRGAPAIGIAAAYGVVLAARTAYALDPQCWQTLITEDYQRLAQARPTAVNLTWALARMLAQFPTLQGDPVPQLLAEAQRIQAEDIAANLRMGEIGAALLPANCRVLTHCNAGALATGGYGTALGVIRSGYAAGKIIQVYATETRPWLQGARLTTWELLQEGIPVTLLCDSAAAVLMQQRRIDWVIVGADRISAKGDVANKIGTYCLAVLARQHSVKLMVVAPLSTLDKHWTDNHQIIIEERSANEVLMLAGQRLAPEGVSVWNPAFDVTPAHLIEAIVTESGVIAKLGIMTDASGFPAGIPLAWE
ncbi:MAG: S-methyl-5-thioribose-1-phosphate isomerase [Beggiatoa sp. IS2]|nr:MAG: S-methyl-5-thioribose-1-phosphate isomerase [Beggiatoa sp. IS2]